MKYPEERSGGCSHLSKDAVCCQPGPEGFAVLVSDQIQSYHHLLGMGEGFAFSPGGCGSSTQCSHTNVLVPVSGTQTHLLGTNTSQHQYRRRSLWSDTTQPPSPCLQYTSAAESGAGADQHPSASLHPHSHSTLLLRQDSLAIPSHSEVQK